MSQEMPKRKSEDENPQEPTHTTPSKPRGFFQRKIKTFTGFDFDKEGNRIKPTERERIQDDEPLLPLEGIEEEPLPRLEGEALPAQSIPEELKEDPIAMATHEQPQQEGTESQPPQKEKKTFHDSAITVTSTKEGVISEYEELDKRKDKDMLPQEKKWRAKTLKPYLHKLTKREQILDSEKQEDNITFQKSRIKILKNMEIDIKAGNLWKKNDREAYKKAWDNLREWAKLKEVRVKKDDQMELFPEDKLKKDDQMELFDESELKIKKVWGDSEQKEYKKEIENIQTLLRIGEDIQKEGKEKKSQEDYIKFKQNQVKNLKDTKQKMEFDGKWDAEARKYYQSSWEKLQSFSKNKDVNIWTDEDEKEFKRETEEIRDPEKWKVGLGIITFALYGFAKAGTMLFQKTMEMVGKIDKDLDIYSDYKKSVKMRKDFFSGKLFKDLMGKQQKKEKKSFEVDEREINKKRKESEIAFWKKEKEDLQKRGLWEGDANEKNRRDYEKVWRDIRIDWIANVAWNKEDEKEFREQIGYPLQQETDTYEGLAEKARWLEDTLTSAERGDLRSLQDRKRKREKDTRGKPEDKDIKQEIKEISYDIDDIKNKAITRWKNGEWPPYTQNEGKTKGKKGKGRGRRQEEAPEKEVEEKEDNEP